MGEPSGGRSIWKGDDLQTRRWYFRSGIKSDLHGTWKCRWSRADLKWKAVREVWKVRGGLHSHLHLPRGGGETSGKTKTTIGMRPLKLVHFDSSTKALQFEKFLRCHGYFAFFILIQMLLIELYSREFPFDLFGITQGFKSNHRRVDFLYKGDIKRRKFNRGKK